MRGSDGIIGKEITVSAAKMCQKGKDAFCMHFRER